jgi:poly(hydroxyalkanoate) depolymerase family esterase
VRQPFARRPVLFWKSKFRKDASVIKIRKKFGSYLAQQGKWERMMGAAARMDWKAPGQSSQSSHLTESRQFGPNPGNLRMFTYLPPDISPNCPLMIVLHGCTQTAADYDRGAGWSTLAERFGFALLLPEQQRSNNPNGCFNWFQTGDIERGQGEALSIRQMVAKMVSDHGIDAARVYVTGLSAGGAMTSVMLATYPDVFAGGAIIAGLPYVAANNVQQAFENMFQCPPRPARVWGDLVRGASQHKGEWPLISIWHGSADATVIPPNAIEIVKQWADVHGLAAKPSFQTVVDGYPRQVWVNDTGDELIESYSILNMTHRTPLATGQADEQCGAAGPYLLEVGISSSYHIAKFFGLTSNESHIASMKGRDATTALEDARIRKLSPPTALEGEVLGPNFRIPERADDAPSSAFDIGAVITKALKAAGLMKGP